MFRPFDEPGRTFTADSLTIFGPQRILSRWCPRKRYGVSGGSEGHRHRRDRITCPIRTESVSS